MVVVAEDGVDVEEEPAALLRIEVADGAAEEGEESLAVAGQLAEVAVEVADDGMHLEPGPLGGDGRRRRPQRRLGDVERHEPLERTGGGEAVEQEAGLLRRARAELDQGVGGGQLGDLGGAGGEDRALGAGRVVLRQPRDLLEQRRPCVVVEPDGRRPRRHVAQAARCLLGEMGRPVGRIEMDVHGHGRDRDGGHRGYLSGRWRGARR